MNSDDLNGAVGKGVQPPDGTTERFRAALIVIHGIATTRSIDDRLHRIATLCQRALAEPSMSTTSPSADSGTDERTRSQKLRDAGITRRPSWRSLPKDGDDDESEVEGGAKP